MSNRELGEILFRAVFKIENFKWKYFFDLLPPEPHNQKCPPVLYKGIYHE